MSEAHGLTADNLLTSLPPVLQNDEGMYALASAIAGVLSARPSEIDSLRIYAAIDTLPEKLLDILAYDFKVDWWHNDCSVGEKRQTLKDSWRVHRMLGTKAAVELAVLDVFGCGKVTEWFQYGGAPYHFKVSDIDPNKIENNYAAFLALLHTVKRLSAVLDSVTTIVAVGHHLYAGFAVHIGRHVTIDCATEDLPDTAYLVDESRNILADELGDLIIDEEA